MKQKIMHSTREAIEAISQLTTRESLAFIETTALQMIHCYQKKGKILLAGNGGSLCDASHFAEELTGFFRKKRPPLSAIALADPGHITCVANDTDFSEIFSRGVQAHGNPGDLLIVLTTSGNSLNLVNAVKAAKEMSLYTIGFLGKDGGRLRGMCDIEWIVADFPYSDRVQEAHMAAIHIIIEQVESALFSTHLAETSKKESITCSSNPM